MPTAALLYASAALAFVLAIFLFTADGQEKQSYRLLGAALSLTAALNGLAALMLTQVVFPFVGMRPVMAAALPVIIFLHLRSLDMSTLFPNNKACVHLFGPFAVAAMVFSGAPGIMIDTALIVISMIYAGLALSLTAKAQKQEQEQEQRVPTGILRWRWAVTGWLVIATLMDLAILVEINDSVDALSGSIAFGLSGLFLASAMAYLVSTQLHGTGPLSWLMKPLPSRPSASSALIHMIETKMETTKAYLDPDMTLSRFGKKTGLPARTISETVNQYRSKNFNQWLNDYRVREAQRLMREDPSKPFADLLLCAGFQNKSTFNAAFKATAGIAPSLWRREHC